MAARRLSISPELQEIGDSHRVAVASNPAFQEPCLYRADEAERKHDPHCKFDANPTHSGGGRRRANRLRPTLVDGRAAERLSCWAFTKSGSSSCRALLLNITPGPDTAYMIGRSMQMGWRGGAAAALGISCGCLVHVLGAAIGLSALLMASSTAFAVVKLAGAAYLCSRLQMLLSRPAPVADVDEQGERDLAAPGVLAGRVHQRAQSEGGAVLPGLPAAIRRGRFAAQAAGLPDARPDLHLQRHAVVPGVAAFAAKAAAASGSPRA